MYNTALFLAEGEGGPRDPEAAAGWLRKAAERGVVDAQYNLGLMYLGGQGIEAEPDEARRWFALAAKAGDAAAADKLAQLTPEPAPVDFASPAEEEPGIASVIDTQTYLARQGYYIGPIDGALSPELKAAADAYMRDRPGAAPGL